jgi:hypothetical protein
VRNIREEGNGRASRAELRGFLEAAAARVNAAQQNLDKQKQWFINMVL